MHCYKTHTCTFVIVLQEKTRMLLVRILVYSATRYYGCVLFLFFSWDLVHATFQALQPCIEVGD